ncbi:DUF1566 domain-containing protein [Brucellaceae bacterium C25G]
MKNCKFYYLPAFLGLVATHSHAAENCILTLEENFITQGEHAEDRRTGLIWKRCAAGMKWDETKESCIGQPQSFNQKTALEEAQINGKEWRVPSGEELETLLVDTCAGPKINTRIFPSTEASDYGEGAKFWTSTEAMPGMFYYFDFTNGWVDMHSAGYRLSLILVKNK